MTHMLRFVNTDREPPRKRPASERSQDFGEIEAGFEAGRLRAQASRCSQCGVPFCSSGCPLGNHIPDWLRLAAEGNYEEAYRLSSMTSTMPEICGRICPQDRLCEGSCVIEQSGHGTVTIGAVEKTITEIAWEEGWVRPVMPSEERPQSIAVIGAGPAGLAAAERLRERGFKVTVYDRYDRPGGLLTYGIPNFKLDKAVVMRRISRLMEAKVDFVHGVEIGRTVSFDELRERHAAVLIATGVYRARTLQDEAQNGAAVPALSYLTASNRRGFGDDLPASEGNRLDARGKEVLVIGGGDTAMDCVRTAIRQGATSVTCAYRRDRDNMPGSAREVVHAEEEGAAFRWLSAPRSLRYDGEAVELTLVRMRLGATDGSSRQAPEPVEGGEEIRRADLLITALGYEPDDVPATFGLPGLKLSPRGTIRVDPETFETSEPGIFAAGDIVRGASLVVWAVHDGQKAAAGIEKVLSTRSGHAATSDLRVADSYVGGGAL